MRLCKTILKRDVRWLWAQQGVGFREKAHLAGHECLDVEAEHREHGQTAVLDLLGLREAARNTIRHFNKMSEGWLPRELSKDRHCN